MNLWLHCARLGADPDIRILSFIPQSTLQSGTTFWNRVSKQTAPYQSPWSWFQCCSHSCGHETLEVQRAGIPKHKQIQRAHKVAQLCLEFGHSCWKPDLPLDILCTLFTAGSFCSAAAKELLPTLEFVPHLKWGWACLYQTPLQGLQGVPDKAFQLAAASGKSTSMFCIQYLNASHSLPFRLLSQITAPCLSWNPRVLSWWPGFYDHLIHSHLWIVQSISLNQEGYWNSQSIISCHLFLRWVVSPMLEEAGHTTPSPVDIFLLTFGRVRCLFATWSHPQTVMIGIFIFFLIIMHPFPYHRGLLQTLTSFYLSFPFYNGRGFVLDLQGTLWEFLHSQPVQVCVKGTFVHMSRRNWTQWRNLVFKSKTDTSSSC